MKEQTIKKVSAEKGKDFSYHLSSGDYREPWRIFRIMSEFVEGYQFLSELDNEVTVLGSARFNDTHPDYESARRFGQLLAKSGYTTITGGGPGIMEATNRGAHEMKGNSVGLNIQLPFEQRINPYVDKSAAFYYFFTRKVMMTSPAHAYAYFPGGFGTMDEFFEVTDLMELGLLNEAPLVMVNSKFWKPLLDFISTKAKELGSVTEANMDMWHLVDTPEEAIKIVNEKGCKDYHSCELSPKQFHDNRKLDWKIFRIMSELVEGFEFLTGLEDDVTVLGTKSIKPGDEYYDAAEELGSKLAQGGYAVITGAGKGIAEAANKGCIEQGGDSIGIAMHIGENPILNNYLTKSIVMRFPFTRKLMITAPSKAFVFFPGGLGTLHQLFEVLTLIQTKKIPSLPIILYDHEFWGPLHAFIKEKLVHEFETVSTKDTELYQIVDDVNTIVQIIDNYHRGA